MELDKLRERLTDLLGTNQTIADLVLLGLVIVVCFVAYFIARRVVLNIIRYIAGKTATQWDNMIVDRGVFDSLAQVVPVLLLYYFSYLLTKDGTSIVQRLLFAYVLFIVARTADRLLDAVNDIYTSEDEEKSRRVPIKGYLQIVKMAVYIFAAVVIFSSVIGKSPWVLLSGLGAASAVLLLVFKDTILSFVASIQIASNDMIRIGDWISMPKNDVDGDVIEIALHTVRVQNWDKTISTVPTHRFIEEPFKNWRGMQESGGRRIKRSVHIDQTAIRFLTAEDFERLSRIELLAPYLKEAEATLSQYNSARGFDGSTKANGRHLTNIGTFREYLVRYLEAHQGVHSDMTRLVRQLAPGPMGVPIEIYVFTKNTQWVAYEDLQGDIFDHILAALPEFGLRVFQHPTSAQPQLSNAVIAE